MATPVFAALSNLKEYWYLVMAPIAQRKYVYIESFVITSLAIMFGWLFSPEDPLLQHAAFPWLWFAPFLIALRYGVLMGILSSTLLVVDAFYMTEEVSTVQNFPLTFFLGGFILTLIAGEFSSVWQERSQRKEEANLYLEERHVRLTRRHLLLKLSHDRLEEEMLSRPGSLRSAIQDMNEQKIYMRSGEVLPAANLLLALLAQYCLIEEAALYPVNLLDEEGKFHLGDAVAVIGNPPKLLEDDMLLKTAIKEQVLSHVGHNINSDYNDQLLIAPLVNSLQGVVGVLAVRNMPFFALNEENLQLLLIILSYYTDIATETDVAQYVMTTLGQKIDDYMIDELARLIRIAERTGISSRLLILKFTGDKADILPDQIQKFKRGLDIMSVTEVDHHPVLLVLMPFATPSGVEGFNMRIESWLQERHHASYDQLGIDVYSIRVEHRDVVDKIKHVLSDDT